MAKPDRREFPPDAERRVVPLHGRPAVAGVPVRQDDIEPTTGLHWVAVLFRVLAGLLVLLMVVQVTLGLTSTVDLSFGVLFAEAIRLVIFACLLWGAGDLADLFVKSHCDLRASRILLGRLVHLQENPPPDGDVSRGRGDVPR